MRYAAPNSAERFRSPVFSARERRGFFLLADLIPSMPHGHRLVVSVDPFLGEYARFHCGESRAQRTPIKHSMFSTIRLYPSSKIVRIEL